MRLVAVNIARIPTVCEHGVVRYSFANAVGEAEAVLKQTHPIDAQGNSNVLSRLENDEARAPSRRTPVVEVGNEFSGRLLLLTLMDALQERIRSKVSVWRMAKRRM